MIWRWIKIFGISYIVLIVLATIWASQIEFKKDFSPILFSSNKKVLSVKVAKDAQWRFEQQHSLPSHYLDCLMFYEDKNYYKHLGIDPTALVRAIIQNIKAKKIVSGGSTISMQLARLILKSKSRNLFAKFGEMILASGLEFRYSKKQILEYYAEQAPFGSNVVGLESAIFRYYNKNLNDLSWAEAALFAILPNQPSLIHISKNRTKLLEKRNRLLAHLFESKIMSNEEYQLSLLENIPEKPEKINRIASHALDYLQSKYPEKSVFNSTIDSRLQEIIQSICLQHHSNLIQNDIKNLAVLVVDNHTQKVITYIGNAVDDSLKVSEGEVNMVVAPRSSGSILKPFLVAAALDKGMVINSSLLPDIPTVINGFKPENFNRNYTGACTVHELIRNSLNIPSVILLKDYGVADFYQKLKDLQFTNLFRKPYDYGLSLILGGAEINMWDLTSAYVFLLHNLNHYYSFNHQYLSREKFHLNLLEDEEIDTSRLQKEAPIYSAGSIKCMFDNMRNPYSKYVTSESSTELSQVAWKTGTSFGYKDAWCIGITPDHTVCVWLGNANGLARPGLIGIEAAAPLMFQIMNLLPNLTEWTEPYDDYASLEICRKSGYQAGRFCEEIDSVFVPKNASNLKTCPYHKSILLDAHMNYQVYANCEINAVSKNYFVLPPLMAHYYSEKHSDYLKLPEFRKDCINNTLAESEEMEFIYPNAKTSVVIPIDLDNEKNIVIFKAVHKNRESPIHWFIDDHFIQTTYGIHELKCSPLEGKHVLSISDNSGQSRMVIFEVLR